MIKPKHTQEGGKLNSTDIVNLFKEIIAGNFWNLEEDTTFKHKKQVECRRDMIKLELLHIML